MTYHYQMQLRSILIISQNHPLSQNICHLVWDTIFSNYGILRDLASYPEIIRILIPIITQIFHGEFVTHTMPSLQNLIPILEIIYKWTRHNNFDQTNISICNVYSKAYTYSRQNSFGHSEPSGHIHRSD